MVLNMMIATEMSGYFYNPFPGSSKESRPLITPEEMQNYLFGKKPRLWKDSSNYTGSRDANDSNDSDQLTCIDLPSQIRIENSTVPGKKHGVFSISWIKKATEMGPYTGRIINNTGASSLDESTFMWEIFDAEGCVSHFIDGKDELDRNWMCHIQCARTEQEQNLEVVQHANRNIYYRAMKDIPPNTELLVWYGHSVEQYMGIPLQGLPNRPTKWFERISNVKEPTQCEIVRSSRLRCTICKRGFNSRSNLRSHMRVHTMEKPFHCSYCKKAFSQSSTLRNHVRLHTGERPYRCTICKMAYSQLAGLRAHQKSAKHRPRMSNRTSTPPPPPDLSEINSIYVHST